MKSERLRALVCVYVCVCVCVFKHTPRGQLQVLCGRKPVGGGDPPQLLPLPTHYLARTQAVVLAFPVCFHQQADSFRVHGLSSRALGFPPLSAL